MNDGFDRNMEGPFRTAEEAIAWITGLTAFGIRPGLERIEWLMEKFNYPHRRLKFIHVAGTNGKGSVCAFLTSVLRQCGYDVGTFTSPYLTSYTDRLKYNETNIDDETLVKLANRLKPAADQLAASPLGAPTMFEVTTALALLYFGTVTFPDYVVWETGLGGRMDVTNIVIPVVSVITNVGHDHHDVLGPTLEDIAREKAGIIKPGVPAVIAESRPELAEIFREKASNVKAPLYFLGEKFHYESMFASEEEQIFSFQGPFRDIPELAIGMSGKHQQKNAAAAVMALEILRQYYALIMEDDDLAEGLRRARWPGRMEMVSRKPRILLDGAHNPEGMEALASALQEIYTFDRLNVLLAMMPNKNHEHSLRHILPMSDLLVITEPDYHKKMRAEELAGIVRRLQAEFGRPRSIIVEPDWRKALETLVNAEGAQDRGTLNVVTGTLYLVADVRSWLLDGNHSEKGW